MRSFAYIAFLLSAAFLAHAHPAAQTKAAPRRYTAAEYNAYQAAQAEQDPSKRAPMIEDFISQFPKSALLVYVYPLCYETHFALKNYPRVLACADELVQLGENVSAETRYRALYEASVAYNKLNSDDPELAAKAQKRALAGANLLSSLKRPDMLDANEFEADKRRAAIYLDATAGHAAITMKDYPAATNAFKAVIAVIDSEPVRPIGTRSGLAL
jgi:hypothetical protein